MSDQDPGKDAGPSEPSGASGMPAGIELTDQMLQALATGAVGSFGPATPTVPTTAPPAPSQPRDAAAATDPDTIEGSGGISDSGSDGGPDIKLDAAYLSERVGDIVRLAMDGPHEDIADVFMEVGLRYGPIGHQAVYTMCCGLAELVIILGQKVGAFERDEDGGGFYAMEVCEIDTDRQVNPDEVGGGARPVIAGHRFVIAQLNGDTRMGMDLFMAQPVLVSVGLAALAGAFGRRIREDEADSGSDSGDGGGR